MRRSAWPLHSVAVGSSLKLMIMMTPIMVTHRDGDPLALAPAAGPGLAAHSESASGAGARLIGFKLLRDRDGRHWRG
eukprot:3071980-Rhodomonas_salina.1